MGGRLLHGTVLHSTYRILRAINEGGMGVVYDAENVRLPNVRYAIKVLSLQGLQAGKDQATYYERFRREAEIVSSLRHPNIVGIVDYNRTEDGCPYLVMERLEGEDLDARLRHQQTLSLGESCRLMKQVGTALQHVHDRGVIHRDLKPGNLFLASAPDGWVAKILDFGISKDLEGNRNLHLTSDGPVFMGTAAYMAPEQARGEMSEVDSRADIFALASILYRCLTARRPFEGATAMEIRLRICDLDPPPVSRLNPTLPQALDAVIRRAHAKDKTERYARVDELVSDLLTAAGAEAELSREISSRRAAAVVPGPDDDIETARGRPIPGGDVRGETRRGLLVGDDDDIETARSRPIHLVRGVPVEEAAGLPPTEAVQSLPTGPMEAEVTQPGLTGPDDLAMAPTGSQPAMAIPVPGSLTLPPWSPDGRPGEVVVDAPPTRTRPSSTAPRGSPDGPLVSAETAAEDPSFTLPALTVKRAALFGLGLLVLFLVGVLLGAIRCQ